MKIFRKKQETFEDKKALEELIKNTFCNLDSVVSCAYYDTSWCPQTCGWYKRAVQGVTYWK